MSIKHHVVTTEHSTFSIYTLQCDTCHTYDAAKSGDLFRYMPVYFGWSAYREDEKKRHRCGSCSGFLKGLSEPRVGEAAP